MFEKNLGRIAGGIFIEQLKFLRLQGMYLAPEDIYLLLDPAKVESTAEDHFARWAAHLEAVRNIFILLPILITWLSLGMAAVAYAQIYSLYPQESFLKLWADGFPGVTWPVPAFPVVAALDVILLTFLLSLTAGIQSIEWRARSKAAWLRTQLDRELLGMVIQAQRQVLSAGPGNRKPAWAGEVQNAMNHLAHAVSSVEDLVKASQESLKLMVDTSHRALENLVQTSQATLEGSSREFSRVLSDHRAAVNEFISSTTDMHRAVDKLSEIYVSGERIYRGLNDTMPGVRDSFKTMAEHQEKAASALTALSGNSNRATLAITEIAQQFTDTRLISSTTQAAGQMQQTSKTMESVAGHIQYTVQQQADLQLQLKQLLPVQMLQATGKKRRRWWHLW